jgi:hypothetical protein
MDSAEIGKWTRAQEIAKEHGLTIVVTHEAFRVEHKKKVLGACLSVSDLYHLVCGYDWGVSENKGGAR